jgi:hypothetical protein
MMHQEDSYKHWKARMQIKITNNNGIIETNMSNTKCKICRTMEHEQNTYQIDMQNKQAKIQRRVKIEHYLDLRKKEIQGEP